MKTNKEQEKTVTVEDLATFKCETDLQPKIVHGGPTTGYRVVTDFSWAPDPDALMDATEDDKNYVPVDFKTPGPYDEVCSELHKAAEICRKANLTDVYNDVFRCIVAKLDQEVAEAAKATNAVDDNSIDPNYQHHHFCKGVEVEARTIRVYVQKLFNDTTFRYHELYELLGDK